MKGLILRKPKQACELPMNLLGKAYVWDNLIRVENSQAAAELLEMSENALSD